MNIPLVLQIETHSTCNARCHFCTYKNNSSWRKGKMMDGNLFREIIDQAATIPQITTTIFHGLNEPLLDPRLEDFIAYTGQTLTPNVIKNIFTNGVSLSPDRFDSLKAAGLDSIIISLNAISQEQHEKIMGLKGKFDIVTRNCEYAIEHKSDMEVQVHTVLSEQFTKEDAYIFLERWGVLNNNGHGLVVHEGNWAGDNTTRNYNLPKPNECCNRATRAITVDYRGKIVACCFDPLGKLTFGDLNESTLRDIYNSDKYVQFREDHSNDEADKYEICKDCTRI